MDSFEFVQIPISIVLGFAISEILAGWGHQLRRRNEQNYSTLQKLLYAKVDELEAGSPLARRRSKR